MTKTQARDVATFLFACFPHITPAALNIVAYSQALERMHYSPAIDAVTALAEEPARKFVPTIGEIREAYDALRRRQPDPAQPALPTGNPRLPATPDQAWTIEGATWAAARARGAEVLPDGMSEANLAKHEAEAQRIYMSRGETPQERAASVRREFSDLIKSMRERSASLGEGGMW